MMAIVVKGDALVKEDVAKAFASIEEVDAVVSTIGGTPADPAADSEASHTPQFPVEVKVAPALTLSPA